MMDGDEVYELLGALARIADALERIAERGERGTRQRVPPVFKPSPPPPAAIGWPSDSPNIMNMAF